MRVVMAHTFYKQRGGEDESFEAESRLLEDYGHDLKRYVRHNNELDHLTTARIALNTVWNQKCARDIGTFVRDAGAEIVHFQNTFPLMSPAVYSAVRRQGAAVVQSLRNYRMSCVNGLLFRDGHICEACTGRSFALPGIVHRCYRHSRVGSAVVASMQSTHKLLRTYDRQVDLYIAVSQFVKDKYVQFGLDERRIVVKPNFIYPVPEPRFDPGSHVVCVGRLSSEKGVGRLIDVWLRQRPELELRIIGDGPERAALEAQVGDTPGVRFLGRLPLQQTYREMAGAAFVVVPSESYETFGRTAAEGLALGTPVISARIGGLAEIVDDGVTGFTFEAGSTDALTSAVARAMQYREDRQLRVNARAAYERSYSPDANHSMLTAAYRLAGQHRDGRRQRI